jgi:cytochrome c-type biogenesis protein CcmH/NrfG
MIQEQENLESIVSDLENASRRFPGEINVWQNLGDAYIRLNKVPEALNAFIAAEKLLS